MTDKNKDPLGGFFFLAVAIAIYVCLALGVGFYD